MQIFTNSLAKDIREAIKGKELDPNKQLDIAAKLAEVWLEGFNYFS